MSGSCKYVCEGKEGSFYSTRPTGYCCESGIPFGSCCISSYEYGKKCKNYEYQDSSCSCKGRCGWGSYQGGWYATKPSGSGYICVSAYGNVGYCCRH